MTAASLSDPQLLRVARGVLGSVLGRTRETGRSLAGTAGPALAHTQRTAFELAQSPALSTLPARFRSRVLAEVAAQTGTEKYRGEGLRDQRRHCENVSAGRPTTTSRSRNGGTPSRSPSLSADGRFVVFASDATNLVADDKNNFNDAFASHSLECDGSFSPKIS